MLGLNFLIFFIVDNAKRNRRSSSIIRPKNPRAKSVSFAAPLVVQPRSTQRIQNTSKQVEEIEMVNLAGTIPPQPQRPAPVLQLTSKAKQSILRPTRPAPKIPSSTATLEPMTRHIKPLNFPNFPPPAPPQPLARSMSTRLPTRNQSYKTFTIIVLLS